MSLKDMGRKWAWAGLLALATGVPLAGCAREPARLEVSPTRAYVDARVALEHAADDRDARVRANAVEALAAAEGAGAGGFYMQALRDDRLPVVAAAAMAVGDTRYEPALPALEKIAAEPRTPAKLMCSVIYALHQLGNDTYTERLGALIRDRDKLVRAEAARVMGKMGDPSAIGPLKALQRDDRDAVVRLNVAESLALLGDEQAVGLLEAFTKSRMVEDRLVAIEALGKVRQARSITVLRRVARDHEQSPLVRVAATGALASLGEQPGTGALEPFGDQTGKDLVLRSATNPRGVLRSVLGNKAQIEARDVVTLQTLAVGALEKIDDRLDVNTLEPMMLTAKGSVKVAAAKAVLHLLRDDRPSGGELASTDAPAPQAPAPAAVAPAPGAPASKPFETVPATPAPELHTSGARE